MLDNRIRNRCSLAAVIVGGLGVALLSVPATNVYRDLAVRGHLFYPTLLESAVPAMLAGTVLAVGIWLGRTDRSGVFAWTVARWTVALTIVVGLTVVWTVALQLQHEQGLKPMVLAGNTLIVGGVGGAAVGIYNGRVREKQYELRTERDRFSALFENVPNSVVSVRLEDGDPIVESVNPAFEAVFGFSEEEIRGQDLNDHVVPATADDPAVEPGDEQAIDPDRVRGEWHGHEVTLKTEEGLREFIRMTVPVETETQNDRYGIYIDITERKQRKERLRVLSRILRHDIRNKLTVIMGHAGWLEEEGGAEAASKATVIREAAAELSSLSERSLEIEQAVSGDKTLRSLELRRVVEQAVEQAEIDHDDWTLELDCPEGRYVQGTAALPEAVRELIHNAIVHNDSETPHVQIRAGPCSDSDYCELVIADNGSGLPDIEVEEMLDEAKASQINHASGIGLWAANWLVNDAGGELTFEERDAGGTAVTLRLKRSPERSTQGTTADAPAEPARTDSGSPTTSD